MSSPEPEHNVAPNEESEEAVTVVTSHQCSSDRVVFTEEDNNNAWIATDQTVDVTR